MAFGTLLLFSLLMVALPLSAFYSTWQGRLDSLLEPLVGQQQLEEHRLVVAGVLSVLAVNAVLAGFVVAAWAEPAPSNKQGKRERRRPASAFSYKAASSAATTAARPVVATAAANSKHAADAAEAAADASRQSAGLQPPPSRLEQEVSLLVALDVEYTHLKLGTGERQLTLPAEVCAVDAEGRVLLYEHCNPIEGELEAQRWRHVGGAPPPLWQYASPLSEVRQRLAELLDGRILVGHHLRKDLAAMALSHPEEATRDTLQYRELQGRRGLGRKLRELSAEKLGRNIQRAGRRHSPREDAQAAMDLYLRHIHFQPQYRRYEDLVESHLADILASCSSADEGDAGEGGRSSSSSSTEAGSSPSAD